MKISIPSIDSYILRNDVKHITPAKNAKKHRKMVRVTQLKYPVHNIGSAAQTKSTKELPKKVCLLVI